MNLPKKVAVNTRLLLPNKIEGIGRFCLETLKIWVKKWPETDFYFLFDRKPSEEYLFAKNVHPVILPPQARHPFLYYLFFQISMKKWLKTNKVDLLFSPEGYIPLNVNTPTFNVIHDLNYLHFPEHLPKLERWYYNKFFPQYATDSTHLFTVSEFSKQDIISNYKIKANKIDVIYNATHFKSENLTSTNNKSYTLLYVGSLHGRKNIDCLIEAFSLLKAKSEKYQLRIVGEPMWGKEQWQSKIKDKKLNDSITFTGRISEETLAKEYQNAFALVLPSYFEGFGFPIIEAQANNCPVISSNTSSMPEVGGEKGALYFNPNKAEELFEQVEKLRHKPGLRDTLISEGQQNLNRFSWEKSTDKMLQIILDKL